MASKSPPTEKELTKDTADTSPNCHRSTRIKKHITDDGKKPAFRVSAKSAAVTVTRAHLPTKKHLQPFCCRRVLNKKGELVLVNITEVEGKNDHVDDAKGNHQGEKETTIVRHLKKILL